jgi:hypothetical protein
MTAALYRLRLLVAVVVVLVAGTVATLLLVGGSTPTEQLRGQETATVPAASATTVPAPVLPPNILGGPVGLHAIPVPGPRAEDLIILETIAESGGTQGQLIIWRADGGLKTQLFPAAAETGRPPPGPFQDPNSAIITGMQQRGGDRRELGIVYDATAYGSGSPTSMFVLLRLEGDQWRIVWSAADHTPDWRSSHGRVEFPQSDLSQLVVRSDSAFGRDPLSGVLFEANAGPHRAFVDTWARQGDSYVRTSAETVPSAYATLVEFLYGLGTGDDSGARALVTDASLVTRARELSLDAYAGKNWIIGCANSVDCGIQAGPISFYAGPLVVILFVEQSGQWLISDIQNEPSP